ncbi:MAG: phage virion morphogenesis protein [Magnetococcales bacterium]|nr:phage virion morphogenesis protein [Magnetococcales bacterium]
MAGTQIKFEIRGLEAVQNALQDLQARGRSLGPALKEIGEHMVESTQDRFDAEQDPDGRTWAPLAEATKKRISEFNGKTPRGGEHILRDSRYLRQSITYQVAGDELRVGTIAVYGAIHQLGGEAGPTAHRVSIPARPFLGVSDADQEYALEVIRDHLLEG